MNLNDFLASIESDEPHEGLTDELQALRVDAQGDWEAAHQIVQSLATASAAWVHAYLHRKEGDLGNASYWYSRAGKAVSNLSLDQEWHEIATALVEQENL